MKRTHRFVKSVGTVDCVLEPGRQITLPVFPGIFKHPTVDELRELLAKPEAARKYTILALRKAPWPVLREFPHSWLEECLENAELRDGRAQALRFLLTPLDTGAAT
jgi:hypothetical protein